MDIHEQRQGEVLVLAVSGFYRPGPVGVSDLIAERLQAGERRFVLDLRGIPRLTTIMVGEFLQGLGRVRRAGCHVVLLRPSNHEQPSAAWRAFESALPPNSREQLTLFDTLEDALHFLAARE